LNATFSANQDSGIVSVTDFDTVSLTISGGNTIDMRSSSGVDTISVAAANATTDDLTINRLSADTAVAVATHIDALTTTTQTGTSQTVKFTATTGDIDNLVLDAATTTLTLVADDGDANAGETGAVITTDITGAALTKIIVNAKDDLDLSNGTPTTVTTIDGSGSTGIVTATITATSGTTSLKGGTDADVLTGGNGAKDTIVGGKGNDTLVGQNGVDTYVFESSYLNGLDTITFVQADDKLDFSAFGTFTVEQNGGLGTAITPIAYNSAADVNITNKIVLVDDANADNGDANVDTAAKIAALIDGAGDAMSITAGGKAVVIAGNATLDNSAANDTFMHIYFVHDANGDGDVSDTNEVVKVGITNTDFDLDTLTVGNFGGP
jgi:hypothetical protein